MKNLILTGILFTLLFTACKDSEKKTTADGETNVEKIEHVEKIAACDVNTAESAATCLCALIEKRDDSELSDEQFNDIQAKIDETNERIDNAIEAGYYTEVELNEVAVRLNCRF